MNTLVIQNSSANLPATGSVIGEAVWLGLPDKSGWVYHEQEVRGSSDSSGNVPSHGGYQGYYSYVPKPADYYPYTYKWDPQLDLVAPTSGYWVDHGRGSWGRSYVDQDPVHSDPPVNPGDIIPDPKEGDSPWPGGGPGTPGWNMPPERAPPFYPEYNRSTAYYYREPEYSRFPGSSYFPHRRRRYYGFY